MRSSYHFLKWKLETEMEQRNKRKQLKIKHSSRDKLVSEGNPRKLHEITTRIKLDPLMVSSNEHEASNANTTINQTTDSGNHKDISKKLRKLLKDPSMKEDIIRYKPGHNIPFRLSEDGIWKSDATIVDKQLEGTSGSCSGSDANNVVSYTGSSTSATSTLNDNQGETGSEESDRENNLSCKDKLYIWWVKNIGIRMCKWKLGKQVNLPTVVLKNKVPDGTSIPNTPIIQRSEKGNNGRSLKRINRILVYIIVSFFILMTLKTVFMFIGPDNEILSPYQKQIGMSAQNGLVVVLCFAHFISFNPAETKDQFDVRHSLLILPFAIMTLGSCLNYGFFKYRQDCVNIGEFDSETECDWSCGFHKWFDLIIMLGSLFSIVSYYSHLKSSKTSNNVEIT